MSNEAGQTLSHYRLVEKIGEGGMGVVWKAVDSKLDREVAVKILPEEFARDPDRMARFEREAKLLAALNHANIAAIHGLDETDGVRFLVMELVPGEDLGQKLVAGPIPVDETLAICLQIAEALEAAHERGIIHRDLKPGNIRITPDGKVKVLDFGLAKAFIGDPVSGDPALSPTITSTGTRDGLILGTAAYMSPEQARGRPLDKRTDIWSFGCVLHESLTGRSAFGGETVSDILASILRSEPNWSSLPQRTPPRIRELLQRCLAKEARNRLRDIGDARLELQRSIADDESLTGAGRRPTRRFFIPALASAVLLGAIAGAALWSALRSTAPSGRAGADRVMRFSVDYPKGLRMMGSLLSANGDAMVFGACPLETGEATEDPCRLYVRWFDRYAAEPVEGSDGVAHYSLSPDGRWIAMLTPVSPSSSKLRLSKVPLDGSSPPLRLLEWPEGWSGPLLWLPDGDLIARVVEPEAVVRIPADGGAPKPPVEIRPLGFEGNFIFLATNSSVLPDGVHVLGLVPTYTEHGFMQSVALLSLETGEARIVVENGALACWSPTGHLIFSRSDTLLALPFDLERLAPTAGPIAITDGLRTNAIWANAPFDLTADGTLLHLPGGRAGGDRRLVFLDGELKIAEPWSEERRPFEAAVAVSSDGRRLAVTIADSGGLYDIWVSDLDRPRLTRLVHEPARDCTPDLWSRDAEYLLYGCASPQGTALYRRRGDGTGEAERMIATGSATEIYVANAFLPDGSRLVATHWVAGEPELVLLPFAPAPDGDVEPAVLVPGANHGQISPDGRWLIYQTDDSGRFEIYLRRIDGDGSLGPEIPVSRGGGQAAIWYRGGASPLEIRYRKDFIVFSVTVTTDPEVRISEPRVVSDVAEMETRVAWWGSYLPDGRSIAILHGEGEEEPTEASIVLNWFSELEERLGSR